MVNFAVMNNQLSSYMISSKVLRHLLLLCMLAGVLGSCRTKNSTDNEATIPNDSEVVESPSATDEINSNQSELLNTIIGETDEGVIRGIAFGDPVSKVKATEKFELFEDSLRHVGFTFETEQLETIDVLYYFTPTGRAVNKITVDVYLNSQAAARQLWSTAQRRLTARFGEPQEKTARRMSWKKSPVSASMVEVSEGKDYGLKFVFEPTDKTMLATR
jgi:hypothetical protein